MHTGTRARVRLSLNLQHHCVQTEIRRQYERCLADCLGSAAAGIDPESEDRLELLQGALEQLDFARLRGGWKALAGGRRVRAELTTDDPGRPQVVLEGRICR